MPTAPTKKITKAAPKVIPIKPLTSWSYTRLSDYERCPLYFRLKHLAKIKEPGSPAMDRGNDRHTDCEQYIKGQTATLHPELLPLADELNKVRAMYKAKRMPVVVEDTWAFTDAWEPTAWDDWVHCWLRIKLDAGYLEEEDDWLVLSIDDWKTGQPNDYKTAEYSDQLALYALGGLLTFKYPNLIVRPRLAWLDAGLIYEGPGDDAVQYTREDLPGLKKAWERRVRPMFRDKTFAPKSNKLCKYCFYGQTAKADPKKNGPGLCKY